MTQTDRLRRFLFVDAPVRGHWVKLSRSWLAAAFFVLAVAPFAIGEEPVASPPKAEAFFYDRNSSTGDVAFGHNRADLVIKSIGTNKRNCDQKNK